MRELPENNNLIYYVCGALGSVPHAMGHSSEQTTKMSLFIRISIATSTECRQKTIQKNQLKRLKINFGFFCYTNLDIVE